MRVKADVKLHNRFDIEVHDAMTGELKQTAKAFNIVLNQMWTRLCGGSSYFGYIRFGTGTGTLDPARTSLFTDLGYKTAVDEELVKAIPNSSWKRKVVLAPEEYVGQTLSEVGIAYSTGSANLVTHAMLEDAEGNPITITKTDTDVITIYATVFVTFSPNTADITLISMPSSNTLVNWLIGGAAAPTGTFRLGSGDSDGDNQMTGCESIDLGVTSTATWTADTANKKRTTGLMRFGTTVANGHAAEFSFPNVFRARLPLDGVFAGQAYVDVPIGTGDGSTTEFILPSDNIRQSSITMKLDDVETSTLTKELINKKLNFLKTPPPNVQNYMSKVTLSKDGKVLAAAITTAPFFKVYDRIGPLWAQRSYPSSGAPTSGSKSKVSLSADGNVLAYTTAGVAGADVYDWVENEWIVRPRAPGNGASNDCALSDNGLVLAIGHDGGVNATVYDYIDNAWVARTSLSGTADGDIIKLSANGDTVAIGDASNYARVYDYIDNAWVARTAISHSNSLYDLSLSDDGVTLACANYGSPYIGVYDWNGTVWTARATPTIPTTVSGEAVALSPDATMMIVGFRDAKFMVYEWIEDAWVVYEQASGMNNNARYGVGLCVVPGFRLACAGNFSSPTFEIVDMSPRETKIIFDTAPAAGVAITSDYTVDGVHKTDQYVIDVGFSIQFGEPA